MLTTVALTIVTSIFLAQAAKYFMLVIKDHPSLEGWFFIENSLFDSGTGFRSAIHYPRISPTDLCFLYLQIRLVILS